MPDKKLEYINVNLNNRIKVKLTEYGRMIYRNSFVSLGLAEPHIKVDEEGYTEFQIHDFINTFGNYFCVGGKLPCLLNVQIQGIFEE